MSPNHTSFSQSIILHCRATEIAVKTLSPVAMTVRILQFYKVAIAFGVCYLSLFSMISNPRKVKSDSISLR